jgi:hypothetical protein
VNAFVAHPAERGSHKAKVMSSILIEGKINCGPLDQWQIARLTRVRSRVRNSHGSHDGELAQLAARFFSIEEVTSSILVLSSGHLAQWQRVTFTRSRSWVRNPWWSKCDSHLWWCVRVVKESDLKSDAIFAREFKPRHHLCVPL